MKTLPIILCGLTAILLVGLATSASAQNAEALRERLHSPAIRQAMKNQVTSEMRSFWNGNVSPVSSMSLLQDDDLREGLGVSQEQRQSIKDMTQNIGLMSIQDGRIVAADPDVQLIQDEIDKLGRNPYAENLSEETRKQAFDLDLKQTELVRIKTQNIINETLTPDQLQKVKEFQISAMSLPSAMPFITPGMFEALDLSDDQKKQLDAIKKDMDSDFEKQMDKWGEIQLKFSEKIQEAVDKKLEGVTDPEERLKIMINPGQEIGRRVREENPDLQREWNEAIESGQGFSNKLKFRMFDVLTDEQMERMAQLIDNPPDYVKRTLRRWRGNGDSETGEWKPGPDSWKPGDGIPEEYRQQREERRFPRRQ